MFLIPNLAAGGGVTVLAFLNDHDTETLAPPTGEGGGGVTTEHSHVSDVYVKALNSASQTFSISTEGAALISIHRTETSHTSCGGGSMTSSHRGRYQRTNERLINIYNSAERLSPPVETRGITPGGPQLVSTLTNQVNQVTGPIIVNEVDRV